jgi:hypothetical protein
MNATRTATIDNALVNQKNTILDNIRVARDGDDLKLSADLWDYSRELWESLGYGYKVAEVAQRIVDKAYDLINEETEFLRAERRNSRFRATSQAHIDRLELIIQRVKNY